MDELENFKLLLSQKDDLIQNLYLLINIYKSKLEEYAIQILSLENDLKELSKLKTSEFFEEVKSYEEGKRDTIVQYENIEILNILNEIKCKFKHNSELVDFIDDLKNKRLKKLDIDYLIN